MSNSHEQQDGDKEGRKFKKTFAFSYWQLSRWLIKLFKYLLISEMKSYQFNSVPFHVSNFQSNFLIYTAKDFLELLCCNFLSFSN